LNFALCSLGMKISPGGRWRPSVWPSVF
jgi:hypothetical protein